jgi:hypothetical protein
MMWRTGKIDTLRLFRLWNEGKSCVEIAAEFKVTSQQVYKAAKRCGLPSRSRKGQKPTVDPTPEEIRERAEAIKQRHLADMRARA